MSITDTIKKLNQGDTVMVFFHPLAEAKTFLLPEEGIFRNIHFSDCEKHPIWVSITQTRNGKEKQLCIPATNCQEILINAMSPAKMAKLLQLGDLITIKVTHRNANGNNKQFTGKFVSYQKEGSNYVVTIATTTEFTSPSGKPLIEERKFNGNIILNITRH